MVTLSFEDVSYRVNGREILHNVSFMVDGGLNVIVGPNGAGKTTLLRLAVGIIQPTNGSVLIDGRPPRRSARALAYVPAQPSLDPVASAIDVAEAMNFDAPDGAWRGRFLGWLERLGVPWAASRRMSSLSSGEQRLVLLAAALSRSPRVLVVDEPLAFLDVRNQLLAFNILRELANGGVTVLAAMHEVMYADRADQVLVLNNGKLVVKGPPSEALDEGLLSAIYGVRFREYRGPAGGVLVPEEPSKKLF